MVKLKAEIQKLSHEKEQLEEKLKDANDENSQMYHQIQNMIGKKEVMDEIDKTEELELTRQMKIDTISK
jgi:seryl-tRNA synthetase